MISAVHHIQISIPKASEPQARAFYCELMGLTEIEKPRHLQAGGGLWLKLGNIQIHLGAEDFAHRAQTKAHLAYQVTSIHHWRAKLQQAQVSFIEPVKIDGMNRIQFADPFGNKIELLELLE